MQVDLTGEDNSPEIIDLTGEVGVGTPQLDMAFASILEDKKSSDETS